MIDWLSITAALGSGSRPPRASAAVAGFVVFAIIIGFFVISSRGEDGLAGALGINHRHWDIEELAGLVQPGVVVEFQ